MEKCSDSLELRTHVRCYVCLSVYVIVGTVVVMNLPYSGKLTSVSLKVTLLFNN